MRIKTYISVVMLATTMMFWSHVALAQPMVVTPASAAEFIGEVTTVEFTVHSGRIVEEKNVGFLNSASDFRNKENFTAFLTEVALKAFRNKGIARPDEHFAGQRIRVHGTISLYRKRPQIVVDDPRQITTAAGERRKERRD